MYVCSEVTAVYRIFIDSPTGELGRMFAIGLMSGQILTRGVEIKCLLGDNELHYKLQTSI